MSDEIIFRDDMSVELVKSSASDADVIWAARVSTAGEQSMDEIILRSGLCRKANSYDLDQLKRVIRKELRQNWYPADWLPKKD